MTEPHTPTLRELQEWMAACVLPSLPADGAARAAARLTAVLDLPETARAEERLAIYVNGFPARVREALVESFPAVEHVVGEGAFTRLVERYVGAVSLESYNLNRAGDLLPAFLRDDEQTGRLPFLPDLAELEWRAALAFHSREETPLDPAPLATWSLAEWERAVLRFQPSVSLVRSSWPIHAIWECRETPVEEIDVELRNRPESVIVGRSGFQVRCRVASGIEAFALGELLDGRPLGKVIEDLSARGEEPDAVFRCFAAWTEAGLITACSPD